jgi:hypothetical protein
MKTGTLQCAALATALLAVPARAQTPARQAQSDDYTRYELLAPDTAQFRILYEVTATTPGAMSFYNVIRKGSEASDEAVYDRMTGERLKFAVVGGSEARASGLAGADTDTSYIRIDLPRAVPKDGGEVRLRIDKTYKDAKSYFRQGDTIVFSRSLGIKRNAVVLPAGYELVGCNFPSQVLTEPDGRLSISFVNPGPAEVPLVVRARPVTPATPPATRATKATGESRSPVGTAAVPADAERLSERAHQDREIVYFLHSPETHAFSLYHDYTESRPGVDRYLNVVRAGSTVSNPSVRLLDTGEALKVETLKGNAITRAGVDIGEPVKADTEVVVVRFPAVKKGQSVRLRIEETYTDRSRYRLDGADLVWDRSLGRPYNAVVLPAGWFLTATSIPAVVFEQGDGRIRLDYVNGRPDEVAVLLKARARAPR